MTKFGTVTQVVEKSVLRNEPRLHAKGSEPQRPQNFWDPTCELMV